MTARTPKISAAALVALLLAACGGSGDQVQSAATAVSGRIQGGLRVLTVDPAGEAPHLRIYRGDYIRLELTTGGPFTIEISDLDVVKSYPVPSGERPYIKVPDAGVYPFRIGELAGTLEALEFRATAYREVSAREAAGIIANLQPLVLDVRTAGEYAGGHIAGAVLIPVQEFQQRIGELAGRENDPVFIYCRSGNRSTVAAKLLVDAGFTQVINLRRGVGEWQREGLPLAR